MLRLIRILCGFLSLEISGDYTDFLNITADHRITLWNIGLRHNNLVACCSVGSFRRLRKLCRKRAFRVHIVSRFGLPFVLKRYRLRRGFAVGFAIYFLLLYFLSSYIWIVRVEGNKTVGKEKIINICTQLGIRNGLARRKLNSEQKAQKVLLNLPDLSFAALNLEGCILTVKVSEIGPNRREEHLPGNLIATKDGVIKHFDVTGGSVCVQPGSAVKKGDILVSGVTEFQTHTLFEHSAGSVYATVRESEKISVLKRRIVQMTTEEYITQSEFQFFHLNIPLFFGKEFKSADATESHNLMLFGRPMPLSFTKQKQYDRREVAEHFDAAKAEKYLMAESDSHIKAEQIEKYTVISQKLVENEKSFTLIREIEYEDDIAEFRPIFFDNQN
ncbi:MAG: sporulation protein YqfD [Clostridia bacterium]|nr:sporulation protein YqfD [Clostridia bacterium]